MASSQPKNPFVPSLTSARFIPAIHVVVVHIVLAFHHIAKGTGDDPTNFRPWCAWGDTLFTGNWIIENLFHSGVITLSFFFTLSGFILTYTYTDRGMPTRVDKREYFIHRFARIYPTYALGLLVSIPYFMLDIAARKPPYTTFDIIGGGLSTIFLVQSWVPTWARFWNPPSWSLSCEFFLYLLFPWLVVHLDRYSRRQLWCVLIGSWICSQVGPVTYGILDPDGIGRVDWVSTAFWLDVVKFNPILRLPEFVVGIALGKLYRLKTLEEVQALRGKGTIYSVGAVLIIFTIALFTLKIPYLMLHNGLVAPLFAMFIYGLVLGGGPIVWFLNRGWVILCGDATYALYMIHTSVIFFAMIFPIIDKNRSYSPMTFVIVCTLICIVNSVITFKKFEVPARRRVRRWFADREDTKKLPAVEELSTGSAAP
ncbi:MAG: acyltransferase [Planctomycetota bacterium]